MQGIKRSRGFLGVGASQNVSSVVSQESGCQECLPREAQSLRSKLVYSSTVCRHVCRIFFHVSPFFSVVLAVTPLLFFFIFLVLLLVSADLDLISVTSSGARAASLVYATTYIHAWMSDDGSMEFVSSCSGSMAWHGMACGYVEKLREGDIGVGT